MTAYQIHHGDCLEVLRTLADRSVDAVVTDPPYGLSFMGKRWDYDVPAVEVWQECLRVLKPGGHLLAFAGTRTQHRMAVRIEDAGFEIRDLIAWVYGSGFPKSLDVSKAIDKRGGVHAWFVEFRDAVKENMKRNGVSRAQLQDALGNFMLGHYLTAGSQPAVPNLRDYQIIRDTVGLGDKWDAAFNAEAEREVVGTRVGVDTREQRIACAVSAQGLERSARREFNITAPATDAARQWQGWGTALKPALEPITVARKPLSGTVAATVLEHGTGALNVDGCRVGVDGGTTRSEQAPYAESGWRTGHKVEPLNAGRWPANLIHDGSEEVVGLFPQAGGGYGVRGKGGQTYASGKGFANTLALTGQEVGYGDSGSAARFFYCAKASKRDRDEGLDTHPDREKYEAPAGAWGSHNCFSGKDGDEAWKAKHPNLPRKNNHPTVKPTDLMRYLCRLVTPPNGTILDPFTGSGSTGKAAMLEGFQFIGIEREAEYVEIAKARIEAVRGLFNA